jgi:hypothetical protein
MTQTDKRVSEVRVRRSLDRAQRRKPLRLWISRRAAGNGAGTEEFVTQVRLGKKEAVVVPWVPSQAVVTL